MPGTNIIKRRKRITEEQKGGCEKELSSEDRWCLYGPGETILFYADGTHRDSFTTRNCWVEGRSTNNVMVTLSSVGYPWSPEKGGAQPETENIWSLDTLWKNSSNGYLNNDYSRHNEAYDHKTKKSHHHDAFLQMVKAGNGRDCLLNVEPEDVATLDGMKTKLEAELFCET